MTCQELYQYRNVRVLLDVLLDSGCRNLCQADSRSSPHCAPFESFTRMTQSEQKRRTTYRFNFYAPAELVSVCGTELTAVTSLSLYGCYLEPTGNQPPGTPVTVKIFCGSQSFEAAATVLYVLPPNQGMGLRFSEVKPAFLYMLGEWLGQALQTQIASPSMNGFTCDTAT